MQYIRFIDSGVFNNEVYSKIVLIKDYNIILIKMLKTIKDYSFDVDISLLKSPKFQ